MSRRLTRGGLTEGDGVEGERRADGSRGDGQTPADRTRADGWRLPAPALEAAVAQAIAGHLEAAASTCSLLAEPRAAEATAVGAAARLLVAGLRGAGAEGSSRSGDGRDVPLGSLVRAGRLGPGTLQLDLDAVALAAALRVEADDLAPGLLCLALPFALRRRGVELKLVAGSVQVEPTPDPKLLGALVTAHRWAREVREGTPVGAIAAREGCSEAHVSLRARLAFLAPGLQAAIVAGTQAPHLTLERIVRAGVPLDWQAQAALYGIGPGGLAGR